MLRHPRASGRQACLPRTHAKRTRALPDDRPDHDEGALRLADGATIGFASGGPKDRLPLVYHHGFLGSRLEPFSLGVPPLGTVSLDRPGYGASTPATGGLALWGEHAAGTLALQGVGRCVVMGVSAGAPYALATALALGSLCERLVLVGGVGGPDMVRVGGWPIRLMPYFADRPRLQAVAVRALLAQIRRPGLRRRWLDLALAEERRVLGRDERRRLAAGLARAVAAGSSAGAAGVRHDLAVLTAPWDVAPDGLTCPAVVAHGTADAVVPYAHALWWTARLPDARLMVLEGEGHVSSVVRMVERLPELALPLDV
ncbi:MAG: alpha/beta hydrolase [Geminicoccaceae bacterium]|nr:alpha/beta hydrolase [Geminicoccaceae bacterium]